jgi:hypothetical protein
MQSMRVHEARCGLCLRVRCEHPAYVCRLLCTYFEDCVSENVLLSLFGILIKIATCVTHHDKCTNVVVVILLKY